jgi:hypothetical protein
MECDLGYKLTDSDGNEFEGSEEAEARLTDEVLRIEPTFGETLSISYRDILELSGSDYRIRVSLNSGDTLTLFNLGYRYEDFLREFSGHRNAVILKDMLVQEKPRLAGTEAVFSYIDENGEERQGGDCELRFYETAIVIVPEMGEIVRVPHSYIQGIREDDYTLIVETEFGEQIRLSMMGARYNQVKNALNKMMHELIAKSQATLKQLLPGVNPMVIRKAALLMREGKAARRVDTESISGDLWKELESKLSSLGVKEEYDYLKSLSQEERICIGFKRDLMGELTGEYVWFLIPIYDTAPLKPGNVVAMEAASGEGGGKATYFFRIVGRKEYPSYGDIQDLHDIYEELLKTINRCMLEINFRREPIYLPDESLKDPRYARYRHAVDRMPSLRTLRRLFIGRVSHRTREQWREDVTDLLKFNVEAMDDDLKWSRGSR